MKYIPVLIIACFGFAWGQSATLSHEQNAAPESRSWSMSEPAGTSIPFQDQQHIVVGGTIEKKNVTTAVLYSLLLPGMGELYVGNYGTGKYFTIIESALWLTMGGYDWYATGLRDDSRRFAIQHAQINLNGKDDQYFVDIGEFRNVYDYNVQILRNRTPQNVYNPATSYWSWDSDASRNQFTDLRIASDERFNDMRFVAAAIAVNHLVSAVNAARMAILHNREADAGSNLLDVHASVLGGLAHPNGIMVSISKTF
jgi:hypothetical protein